MLYKDEAVVLRSMRLGEADRIVTFMGRASGKIKGVAKGVRKTKSRYGGRLEPFTHVSLMLWKGKGDLDTITQVEVIEPFRAIREDIVRFAAGQVMLEAVDRIVEEVSPRTFRLLVDSLHGLASDGSPLVLTSFLLRLSAVAGFAPSLDQCAECGEPAVCFSPGQGGAVCYRCRDQEAEEVGVRVLELMRDLEKDGAWMKADKTMSETASRLARYYAEYHIERRLKSAAMQPRLSGA